MEALQILNREVPQGAAAPPFRVFLACGFTPLHLATFLRAHLKCSFPGREVALETGLYDDLTGNLRRAAESRADAVAVALEWPDLDPRLGVRQLGGWGPRASLDIVSSVEAKLGRLETAIAAAAAQMPLALCPPGLPLPPFSHEPAWQAGPAELALRHALAGFLERLANLPAVRVASPQALDRICPPAERFDLRSELGHGFPYSIPYADGAGELLARLICNAPPKKGLITDLDDTFWHGILGEVGVEGVAWDLARKAHLHGLYQQFLAALSDAGVLVGVASKNDPALVEEAFRSRPDLLAPASALFPVEAGWGRKSESVGRILRAWNIGADSVVFVDDSPLELEEVRTAYPQIETFLFPAGDDAAAWELIAKLHDRFGKSRLQEEDRLRMVSLRRAAAFPPERAASGPDEDEFLRRLDAAVTFQLRPSAADTRPLELINKTNQFNLNGRRLTEAEWNALLRDPDAFTLAVSYRDKFGPLGKIAVIAGRRQNGVVTVSAWVMSCRAFARRVEHQCLRQLFQLTGAAELILDYRATPRNGPLQEFLAPLLEPGTRLCRGRFERHCPALFHTVEGVASEKRGPAEVLWEEESRHE